MRIFEPWREFSVLDVENIRLHYARTLTHWMELFDANADKVRKMFDEKFERMWRLLSRRLHRGLHHRHAAAVPGGVRDEAEQQRAVDARLPLQRTPEC